MSIFDIYEGIYGSSRKQSPEVAWAVIYRKPPEIRWGRLYFPTYPEAKLEAERLKQAQYEVRIHPIFGRRSSAGEFVPETAMMHRELCEACSKGEINPRWVLELYPDEIPTWLGLIDKLLIERGRELTDRERSFLGSLRYYVETERKITIPMLSWLFGITRRLREAPPRVPYVLPLPEDILPPPEGR